MALMAFRNAWVDAVAPVKATIRNLFRDEVAAYLTLAELRAKDTGATRLVLVGGVPYLLDAADSTSADNGFSIVVSNDGYRYKIVSGFREKLTATRTYYVRTDGSDSNDGLANTSGRAFSSIQKAIDVAAALDSSIYDVTIQVANGHYSTATGLVLKSMAGAGSIYIIGDTSFPGNVVLTTTSPMTSYDGCVLASAVSTKYYISGFTLTSTSTGTVFGLLASQGSFIGFSNITFSIGMTQQIRAEDGGVIWAMGNYSITGQATAHCVAVGKSILRVQSRTITITGTLAFTYFVQCTTSSVMFLNGNTYNTSGATVTGQRYDAFELGMIKTNGAGASYLPGSIAGSPTPGSGSIGGEYY